MKVTDALLARLFHLICVKTFPEQDSDRAFRLDYGHTQRLFRRLAGRLDVEGKSVLDVGCGRGPSCIYAALNGARRVVGVDISPSAIDYARSKLQREYPELVNIIEFLHTSGDLKEVSAEKFDIIISQNAFEHYSDPENIVAKFMEFLSEDGVLVIAIAPLWKSPYGGHMFWMTRFPWAHLLFPEPIIMSERRRLDPSDNAQSFEDVGLNRMTLVKFRRIMEASNLDCMYLKTNVGEKRAMKLLHLLSRGPLLEEFFTHNVYSMWRLKR